MTHAPHLMHCEPPQDLVPTRARIASKDEAQSTTYNILSITESLCHAPHLMHCEPTTGLGAHACLHSLIGLGTKYNVQHIVNNRVAVSCSSLHAL